MAKPRIILGDDQPTMLEGLKATLESKFEIVGAYLDGAAVVQAVRECQPDVVIMDVYIPRLNGLQATALIRMAAPAIKVLLFTMYVHHGYIAAAIRAGADGILHKTSAPETLHTALSTILSGSGFWPSSTSHPVLLGAHGHTDAADFEFDQLTPRELEVLQMIADGLSAKQIAYRLDISPSTVTFHRQRIKKKLALTATADLTRYAIEHGLTKFLPCAQR